jgi:hypothetical protein
MTVSEQPVVLLPPPPALRRRRALTARDQALVLEPLERLVDGAEGDARPVRSTISRQIETP